jgi:acyl-coenzyme A thioesterase PaaI-like protein
MDLTRIKASTLRRIFHFWPPLVGAGIRVEAWSDDWRYARVRLKLRWYNRNFVGTQFGGSLFAMTDPFYMIMAQQVLGRDYVVWDKAAAIEFVAPGRTAVFAEFHLDDGVLDEIRAATANGEKYLRWFETEVKTAAGDVIARVRKQIYVRRKRAA